MKKIFVLVVIVVIASMAACKKEIAPAPTCKISKAETNTDTISFSYTPDGKLNSITWDKITTFVYSENTIIAISTSSGIFSSKKIVTLNANGMASNVREEKDATGTDWTNTVYDYDGTELIKSTNTSSEGNSQSIVTYTWTGGNMTSSVSGSSTSIYEYYTNKLSQSGDYLNFSQLIAYGFEIYRSKNALKSFSFRGIVSNIDYSFDAEGKISAMSITGASTGTFNYKYQCN